MAAAALPKKHTPAQREANRQRQLQAHKRKRELLAENLRLKRLLEDKPNPPTKSMTNIEMLFGTMQPGSWYSPRDMHQVSGVVYGSCKAEAVNQWRLGWLERVQNPDWRPVPVGAKQEPKWIYRLSGKALERARLARALH